MHLIYQMICYTEDLQETGRDNSMNNPETPLEWLQEEHNYKNFKRLKTVK